MSKNSEIERRLESAVSEDILPPISKILGVQPNQLREDAIRELCDKVTTLLHTIPADVPIVLERETDDIFYLIDCILGG